MHSVRTIVMLCTIIFSFSTIANAGNATVWDYAPNFTEDLIQPYPSLKNPNGSSLTVDSIRGVHLFGWKGCSNAEGNMISEAYNDFYKLANQLEIYKKIDWNDQVSTF